MFEFLIEIAQQLDDIIAGVIISAVSYLVIRYIKNHSSKKIIITTK